MVIRFRTLSKGTSSTRGAAAERWAEIGPAEGDPGLHEVKKRDHQNRLDGGQRSPFQSPCAEEGHAVTRNDVDAEGRSCAAHPRRPLI